MTTSPELIANLEHLGDEFHSVIAPLGDEHAIRAAQAQFLGKKGKVSELMKELGKLPAGDRPAVGAAANKVKQTIEDLTARRLGELADVATRADLARTVDVTLPARPTGEGHLHLLTQVRLEAIALFAELGFVVADGPQIETDWHNFEALGIPKDHPARDMQDTFFISEEILLRSHTSPVQIRTMLTQKPPIRIIAPGLVYRRDDDLTHSPMFTQLEGLAVDEGISFGDLKGTLLHFVQRFFREDLEDPAAPELLPVHRAVGGGRHAVSVLHGLGLPGLQRHWLARDRRQRHGRSGRVRPRRHRRREVHRLRVRHGPRAHGDASPRSQRHQVLLRRRRSLPGAILVKMLWSWLLELCDLDAMPTVEDGARALTGGGAEIEGIEYLGAGFSGVVVAEVVAKRPHPQADKLTLVEVITERGGTATQVVCGAPNVPAPGRKVLWAQIGAKLPNGLTLSAKPVKGIESPGMLCAEDELGLSEDHAGIVVLPQDDRTPLGASAQQALGLDDHVLELKAAPNRGDLLGHLGVARELCAMLGGRVVPPDADLQPFERASDLAIELAVIDGEACARYVARLVDVKVGPSPRRIAQRLRAVGVRPISNIVDITNYVLFELGQPLHAFDAATLAATAGALNVGVSPALDGETLVTLDGIERTLVATDLVIRDGVRGVALAGVMGGRETEVSATTTRILLESATFRPLSVRKTARRLGLHSEASQRFERGVDPELNDFASRRAARLMAETGSGGVSPAADRYLGKRSVGAIRVRLPRVRSLTGVPMLDAAASTAALNRLGFAVRAAAGDALDVTPPSARADVTREVDVIEEILRVAGYDQVTPTLPNMRTAQPAREPVRADHVRAALAAAGASEAITYGFQSVERLVALGLAATDRRAQPIAVRNPMSADQAIMRTSLLPNLIAAIARNQSFGRPDVALFEVGSVFLRRGEGVGERPPSELADEPEIAAGVLAGRRPAQIGDGAAYDAFDVKALALVAARAVAGSRADRIVVRATHTVPYLHPGLAGELVYDGNPVGWFGELHPDVRRKLGVAGPAFAFEVDLDALPASPPAQMQPIARFPGSARDVSLLLADAIPAARVVAVIEEAREPLVANVRLLEDYRGDKVASGSKSMLWSITYRAPERTLTDAEVDRAHGAIVGRLIEQLPAQQR